MPNEVGGRVLDSGVWGALVDGVDGPLKGVDTVVCDVVLGGVGGFMSGFDGE